MPFVIVAPTLICFVIDKIKEHSSYIIIGIILSAIFLFSWIYAEIKNKTQKAWEGVIVDKFTNEKNDPTDDYSCQTTTYYYIKYRTNDGKVKKQKIDHSAYYDYLNINDRIRYLPQLNNCYEKYDKSQDTYLICPVCTRKNSPANDRCEFCSAPLLKQSEHFSS